MIAAVVVVLFSIIPAIVLAEVIVERRRVAKWKRERSPIDDAEFLTTLGPISASRE